MKEKFTSIFFAGLIITMGMLNIISRDRVFSSKENRYLEEFPKLNMDDIISGKFREGFEKYSTDQFIMRDTWISLKTISDLAILKKDNTRVYFGREDYLFDIDEKIDRLQFNKNINSINVFLEKMDDDIDIYALLVPTKSQILEDKLPAYAPKLNEEEIIDELKNSLLGNIRILSLMDIFKEKKQEYIYYRTDHHWTSKGAFYAYKYFLEEIGGWALMEKDFQIKEVSKDFLGTSYRKANYYSGLADTIDVYLPKKEIKYDITVNEQNKKDSLYEESFLNKTDKYSYFLAGDKGLIDIRTSVENQKTILIVKDSFANSFTPFITNHYARVIVVDPRYFNGSIEKIVEVEDVDEMLFLFNTQTFIQEKSLQVLSN